MLAEHYGADLFCPVHVTPPPPGAPYDHRVVDVTDGAAVAASVAAARPDAIIHCAILNDWAAMRDDRRVAWDAYVGATRHLVDAANAAGAQFVLISTDWVFDGTQGGADETAPPNPINFYGFLKAACELVVAERAAHGAVARVAGVQGVHYARPATPRAQDAGFGYLVASLVDALRAGRRFRVWDGPGLNRFATPTLSAAAATGVQRIIEREATGVFHLCGAEGIDRVDLARAAVEVFGLDAELLEHGPPAPDERAPMPIPDDTRLSASVTAGVLGIELLGVRALLQGLRDELDRGHPTVIG